MALSPGQTLGPYEIVSRLGAGGMGEVYRAKDKRLDRIVAIKVLPQGVSDVGKQRFDREAKTISSLNHPHICTLHDIGSQDGVDYLVMECVEGETLAKQLEKGPLALEQVLKYGAQISDALDKAHRAGIVHRDLKPGNIMLTATGAKLLDFGLAKPAAPLSSLATMTVTKVDSPVTQQGTIVGTFQYMSPEQVEGKELDGRSDIFSLGAVLYEMVTGRRAFEGKSQLSVASAILEKEPAPISSIKPMTPPALDHVIRRCLAKELEKRWQTACDLSGELRWIAEGSQAGVPAVAGPRGKARETTAWAAAAILALAAIALAIGFVLRTPKPAAVIHLSADIGADAHLDMRFGSSAILSPDGSKMAFVATGSDSKRRIYVRSLNQKQANPLSGTENAQIPFFSPEGEWLAFFADGKLRKVSVQGGAVVTLCAAAAGRGGSWGEDGTIVFAPDIRGPLFKVSSAGGTPQPLTTLDQQAGEVTQRWPELLPDGKTILFMSSTHGGPYEDAAIVVYSMSSGQRKTVLQGGYYPRYVRTGHLVYMHEGALFAAPFDLKRLEVTGSAAPVLEDVAAETPGFAQFSFSGNGNLVYVSGSAGQSVSIYWMDRAGKLIALREAPGDYYNPAFSPDGKRLALEISDGKKHDIWVYEYGRDTLTLLTFGDDRNNTFPFWTPDGQRITYASSDKNGVTHLYWKRADGTGEAHRLTEIKDEEVFGSWSPDGKVLVFEQIDAGAIRAIMTLRMKGNEKVGWKSGEPQVFRKGPFVRGSPVFSPDGRWLAYQSQESGKSEVYVQPFSGSGGKWQISTGGGYFPKWSRNGKELFYLTPGQQVMVTSYTVSSGAFHADMPQLWSNVAINYRSDWCNFDVHPDGQRLAVLLSPHGNEAVPINKVGLIFNFGDELIRKLRSGNN